MIQIQQVTRTYGSHKAVDCLTLELNRGELFSLLGHNGAGKTTTMKMLVGLLQPTSGQIRIGPYDVTKSPREASRLVGYVPDQPFLYDKLTGKEFLTFVAEMHGLTANESRVAIWDTDSYQFHHSLFIVTPIGGVRTRYANMAADKGQYPTDSEAF
jgi:ABC-2 type transport system ATP-binding protein